MRLLVAPLDAWVHHFAEWAGLLAEAVGIGVIVVGALIATGAFLRRSRRRHGLDACLEAYRRDLGRAILLGLEFLVAADIVGTVLVDTTFRNLGVLAILVVIRTFLSMALTVEIEGHWPWQEADGARTDRGD